MKAIEVIRVQKYKSNKSNKSNESNESNKSNRSNRSIDVIRVQTKLIKYFTFYSAPKEYLFRFEINLNKKSLRKRS